MSLKQVYTFHCLNCPDYTVLPRQSRLGTFEDQADPSMDTWPITYLCQNCGHVSVVPAGAIHLERVETQDQHPLVGYEFSNGLVDSLRRLSIYSKEVDPQHIDPSTAQRAIENVLVRSRLWLSSYGDIKNVSVDFYTLNAK